MQASETKRLRALDEKNRQLKRVVADQPLNLQVLKACWEESGDDEAAADHRQRYTTHRQDIWTLAPATCQAAIHRARPRRLE